MTTRELGIKRSGPSLWAEVDRLAVAKRLLVLVESQI